MTLLGGSLRLKHSRRLTSSKSILPLSDLLGEFFFVVVSSPNDITDWMLCSLATLEGEWHELETKRERAKKRRKTENSSGTH